MQKLAQTNPQLKGLDLNNLDQTAHQLCENRGEDYDSAKSTIMEKVGQFIANK